jgi:hypothetical protein
VRALLNLALLGLLVLQGFVLVRVSLHQPLELPGFVREALQDRLQHEGVSVQFSAMEVTLSGSLWLRQPEIYLEGTPGPVIEADSLLIEPDWLALVWERKLALSRLSLENAHLYCPPEVSPSGTRETIVSDFDLALANAGGDWWQLDYMRVHILNARILAQGTFVVPPARRGSTVAAPSGLPATTPATLGSTNPAPTLAEQYRALARKVEGLQANFALVQNPVVTLRLDGRDGGNTSIKAFVQIDGAEPPADNANVTLGRMWARGAAEWDGQTLRATIPVVAWLESVSFVEESENGKPREIISGGPAWVRALLASGAQGLLGRPPRLWCMLSPVKVYGFPFDSMGAAVDLEAWPNLGVEYYAAQDKYWLKANGEVDLKSSTVALDFDAYVDPAVILAAAKQKPPKEMQSLKFARPPRLGGHITLAPGYKPEALDFQLQTGGAQYDRIQLYALEARGRLTPKLVDVQETTMWNTRWRVEGGYQQDLDTQDFRILAHGTLDPGVLDPYIDKWWPQVWAYVVPGVQWPHADIDYQGCWDDLSGQTLFGSANLVDGRASGVPVDDLALRIYIRPDVDAVFNIAAHEHGGGQLTGTMLWMRVPPYHKTYEQRYIFASTLPLVSAAQLAGKDVVELTRPLDCPTAPSVQVDQRTGGASNPQPGVVVTKLAVSLPAPFKAYNVPLDSLQGNATLHQDFTDIPHLRIGIANGSAEANATITHLEEDTELAFNVSLVGGHHTGVLFALSQFKTPDASGATPAAAVSTHSPAVTPPAASAQPAKVTSSTSVSDLARPGMLDMTMGGRLLLGKGETFAATGHARVYEAKIGQLQMFGMLSSLLPLSIGSFDLNAATSDIQIANQYARLPNLRVTGPSARIVAAGLYHFSDQQMDFHALLFPLSQWSVPVLSQIINVMSSVNNAFTVRLRGTIDNPTWNVSMDPLRMFDEKTVKAPPIPGYPANPDGSPVLPTLAFPEPPPPVHPPRVSTPLVPIPAEPEPVPVFHTLPRFY